VSIRLGLFYTLLFIHLPLDHLHNKKALYFTLTTRIYAEQLTAVSESINFPLWRGLPVRSGRSPDRATMTTWIWEMNG
jgi:hypothetical protein